MAGSRGKRCVNDRLPAARPAPRLNQGLHSRSHAVYHRLVNDRGPLFTGHSRVGNIRTPSSSVIGETVSTHLFELARHVASVDAWEKRVLEFIAFKANANGQTGNLTVAEIAAHLNCSQRTAQYALAALKEKRIVTGINLPSGSHFNHFYVDEEHLSLLPSQMDLTGAKPAKPDIAPVQNCTGETLAPVQTPIGTQATVPKPVKAPKNPHPAREDLLDNVPELTPAIVAGEVCYALDITDETRKTELIAVIELQVRKGAPLAAIGADMIGAYTEMLEAARNSGCSWGVRRFFTEGTWLDSANWLESRPLNTAQMRLVASQGKVS